MLLDLDLFGQNMVSDFFAVAAQVGSPSEHAFVADHSEREVVHGDSVVLPAHHLRSHVAGSARGILGVVRVPHSRDSEVCGPEVAVGIEDEVLRFDVAVECAVGVEVLERQDNTGDEKS